MPNKLIFPDHGDPEFSKKLGQLREYQMYKTPEIAKIHNKEEFEEEVKNSCFGFEKTLYQNLVAHYLSRRSPYKSLIIYHSLGTGKSCSAITIAETLLQDHKIKEGPKVLIVASSILQKSFEEQIFSYTQLLSLGDLEKQCNGDLYMRLIHGSKSDVEQVRKKVYSLIRSRYKFLTYGDLVEYNKKYPKISDKVIIVDEAHNLRINEVEKKAADALEKLIETGVNNKVVLLTATPMYNEPNEIFWLLKLLLKNDKLPIPFDTKALPSLSDPKILDILKQLSSEYISYIKSANPFTFGVKLDARDLDIPCIDEDWTREVGLNTLVQTELGENQIIPKGEDTSSLLQLELSNIKYANEFGGKRGFRSIFNIDSSNENGYEPLKLSYKREHENYMAYENLGKVASKMKRISDFVATSEGIVIVYSQFAWSGVIPFAIALEHLGFQRYGGNNMLQKTANTSIRNTRYPDIPFPQYCIMSSDPVIMGSANTSGVIDKLVKVINNRNNIHGENIKVILMTKVASEGLSFRNVREVHILDPWYHINRLEQVIGRAIRTCSHTDLPLEERNITIFMHVNSQADIRAYKISARKLKETQEIENLIRDNSLDCNLLLNVNYYPRSTFDFTIVLRTSQQKMIEYHFGDSPEKRPRCIKLDRLETKPITRREIGDIIQPTLLKRMKKFIQNRKSDYINIDDLIKYIGSHEEVAIETIFQGLYPNRLIDGVMIYPHLGRLVVIPDLKKEIPVSLNLPHIVEKEESKPSSSDTKPSENILNVIEINPDKDITLLSAYSVIDSDNWFNTAKRLIEENGELSDVFGGIGALIYKSEVPRLKKEKTKYVGFVNIFNIKDFEVILYENGAYVSASESDMETIKSKREEVNRESYNRHSVYGILEPYKFSKNKDAPYRFTFKIVVPEIGKGGEICTSKRYNQLTEIMTKLGVQQTQGMKKTKDQYCYTIMFSLMKQGKLYIYPKWKPRQ